MSCADWVERNLHNKIKLTPFQRKSVEILVTAFRTGVYNLPINWKRVEWEWGTGIRVCAHRDMATFDFDLMTRLVIAAHDECVRIEVSAAAPGYLYIEVHPRQGREGQMYERHPTMEQAIADFRGIPEARPLSEWHEDIGPVLWWKFPIDEEPYVGTPNDLGQEVMVRMPSVGIAKAYVHGNASPNAMPEKTIKYPGATFNVGGWPGYHTHWTPLPVPPRAPKKKDEAA